MIRVLRCIVGQFFPPSHFAGLLSCEEKAFSIWGWKCFLFRWWPSIYSSSQQKAQIIIIFSCFKEFTTYDDVLSFFYPFFPTILTGQHITELLSQNTTTGMFRKLGRFYESCLRQELNSSSIRLKIEELGGYIPISLAGPSSVTALLRKMMEMGAPLVLFDIYYDLSYGKKPQSLLIVDIPTDVHQILQVSWSSGAELPQSPQQQFPFQICNLIFILPLNSLRNPLSIESVQSKSILVAFCDYWLREKGEIKNWPLLPQAWRTENCHDCIRLLFSELNPMEITESAVLSNWRVNTSAFGRNAQLSASHDNFSRGSRRWAALNSRIHHSTHPNEEGFHRSGLFQQSHRE